MTKKVPTYQFNDYEKKAREKADQIIDEAPKYDVPKPEYNPKPMKRILNAVIRTVTGENKAGESIHGVLDLWPVPNQVIAKAVKYLTSGRPDEAKEELGKLFTVRNIVALVGSIAFIAGWVTIDHLSSLFELIGV